MVILAGIIALATAITVNLTYGQQYQSADNSSNATSSNATNATNASSIPTRTMPGNITNSTAAPNVTGETPAK
ncbi:MAG TPA: hypothetical protein VF884_11105 [Nitrososphaeraceae archaeon]